MKNHRSFENTTPRILPSDVHEVANPEDAAARLKVYDLGRPKVIVVRINSKDTLGLPAATSTPEQLQKKLDGHVETGKKFGVDVDALRDRKGLTHNGQRVYENEGSVRLGAFLEDLAASGYKYQHSCWFQKPAKPGGKAPDPTLHFKFALEGDAVEMTDRVRTFLQNVYVNQLFLWANPRTDDDGATWYRLDTLNGVAGQTPKDTEANPGNDLRLDAEHPSGYMLLGGDW